ncbi:hypothetical protein FB45DRAFT_1023682 [Roridomyces roridus]|uniref:C2H2-type domain-containing protein n=1 Tax=Roridomyces roridus TaxID=1738132 RepID=A0AAD7C4U6_9AGAR|nr:hypothetical protein FB45DRAFT_1023682 [Roridomyces roridus]
MEHACRWNWCRSTFPTTADLLDHVRLHHVQTTQFYHLCEISMLIRAEEGTGQSMSGFTVSSGQQDDSEEPPLKRQKLTTPVRRTASPVGRTGTPSFVALSSPDSPNIPNPELPDLNTMIFNTLAKNKIVDASPGSWSLEGSDDSAVERMLTQSIDSDDSFHSQTVGASETSSMYAGQMNWDDEASPNSPRSASTTPSQSQHGSVTGTSPPMPMQRKQSWYQSPVSRPKLGPSPTEILTSPRAYRSGSLKIHSNGGTLNPSEIMAEAPAQSQLDPFVPLTQAPYSPYYSQSQ